jgi:Mg2+ and Co2+ transporter CorA
MSLDFPFDEAVLKESPEALIKLIKQLYIKVQKLEEENKQVKQLEKEVAKLQAELAKYTSPHIPSSKQLYPKIKKGSQSGMPKASKGKRGGSKKGRSGVTWDQKEPDEVIHNYVEECLNCYKVADKKDQKISYTKRILEIPEQIKISLQEYYIHKYECDCGSTTQAQEPTIEGTSLGPNFLTFMTSARSHTGGSFENLSRMVEDISDVKPSQTSLNRALSKVCDSLEPVANEIAVEVMNSDYFNIDETGHKLVLEGKRSGSKKIWVWVFATPNAAYYHVDMSRSKDAIKTALAFRDQDKPPPISVTDAYPAYLNMFETKQFCWAHLLRDSKEVEDTCLAGKIIHDRLTDMFQRIKALKKKLHQSNRSVSENVYNKALRDLNEIAEDRSCKNVRMIQNHLKRRADHYLTCLRHPHIPMENGHAERLLKSVIVHRSNGKPLRSERAMRQYAILLTVLTTWKLRGLPVGSTLRDWIGKQISQPKLLD